MDDPPLMRISSSLCELAMNVISLDESGFGEGGGWGECGRTVYQAWHIKSSLVAHTTIGL